ncbi:MAG: flagellar M-ring protein FliF [Bacteroidales bacterium]|nr:flagellar M-ring protein FliF [Clostridium sp.]MCM1202720.1 flagellar M-ring protein FliF [Bacteroidales bacterium]
MLDRLKGIQVKIVEFWNRFTSKQKTMVISISAAVILMLVALIVLLNRAHYVELFTFDNTSDAAAAKEVLQEAGIAVEISNNGLTFTVDEKNEAAARLALGENNIATNKNDDLNWLFDNSMSTTDSERQLKNKIVKQNEISEELALIDGVKQASVQITIPDTSNSLLSAEKEASASVLLITTDDFADESVEGIANLVATSLGNKTTDSVRIINQAGTLLFGGDNGSGTSAGSASESIKIKNQVTANLQDRVRSLLVNSGVYNDAEVTANLDLDLDMAKITDEHHYTDDEEEDTGPLVEQYTYDAENADGTLGIPGTDSNDDQVNDYEILAGNAGNSSANVVKQTWHDSVTTTVTEKSVGTVNTANSTIAIVLSRYVVYDEAKMKRSGELQGTNFEAFQSENDVRQQIEVDEETYSLIEKATGIPAESIQISAFEVPLFYPQETTAAETVANYLQFVLAVLIVALLCFVVFKGMKPVEITELEPELSVEALLATTKENQSLEDIEFSDKSAIRQQVERFVDENPQEVAMLLRNWLNDEWDE